MYYRELQHGMPCSRSCWGFTGSGGMGAADVFAASLPLPGRVGGRMWFRWVGNMLRSTPLVRHLGLQLGICDLV